jgi:tRNA pseudouridine-54 N-methylase
MTTIYRFLIILEQKSPTNDFSLKDLPKAGQIDLVSRVILASFAEMFSQLPLVVDFFFHSEDESILLEINRLPKLDQEHIIHDEISIAAAIRKAFKKPEVEFSELISNNKNQTAVPAISWSPIDSLSKLLKTIQEWDLSHKFLYLHEQGQPFEQLLIKNQCFSNYQSITFILGGRKDPSRQHHKQLEAITDYNVSLGKYSYLASSCITKVLYLLTRDCR